MAVDSIQYMSAFDKEDELPNDIDPESYEYSDRQMIDRDKRVFHNTNFLNTLQTQWSQKTPYRFRLILNDIYKKTKKTPNNIKGKKGVITIIINPDAHPTSPWIIGHRIGHALNDVDSFDEKTEEYVHNWLSSYGTAEDIEALNDIDYAVDDLPTLYKITKFKGKDPKLINNVWTSSMFISEWGYECFAQYLKYGKISFYHTVDGVQELEHYMLKLVTNTLDKASQTGKVYVG